MTAWQWLREEIERRLGPEGAAELWRGYWERHAIDEARRKARRLAGRKAWRDRVTPPGNPDPQGGVTNKYSSNYNDTVYN